MYCPNCGTKIPDDSLFCPSCGTQIPGSEDFSFSPGSDLDRRSSGTDAESADFTESGANTDSEKYTDSGEETQFADLRNIRRSHPTPHPSRKDDRSGDRFNGSFREDYEEDDDDDGNSRLPVIIAGFAIAFAAAVLLFVVFRSGFHLSVDGSSSDSGAESISSAEEVSSSADVSSSVDSSSPEAAAESENSAAAVVTANPVISSTPVPDSADSADTAAAITAIPTVTPTAAPTAVPQTSSDDYIIPDSSTRELTMADLEGLTAEEARIAKNEIYARHGRRFKNADLQAYFDSKSWYSGTVDPNVFDANVNAYMNSLEQKNAEFIQEYQKSKGWVS